MATRRMVPTRFFKDPDIMNLQNRETQLILLGLILLADDEGRELAHAGLIGRELDYPAEQIENALQDLEANELILLYQVGRHRYYSLTRWRQWQTMGSKMTPSKYPAPPQTPSEQTLSGEEEENADPRTSPDFSGVPPENSGKSWESSAQFNVIESNLREEEGEKQLSTIIPFPPSRIGVASADQKMQTSKREQRAQQITAQVASNLKLALTPALGRLVEEFLDERGLCLPGEADAAREWIDDKRRNKKHQHMTLAFFRRWLKREREQAVLRRSEAHSATGTGGKVSQARASPLSSAQNRSLMDLEQEYRAVQRTHTFSNAQKET